MKARLPKCRAEEETPNMYEVNGLELQLRWEVVEWLLPLGCGRSWVATCGDEHQPVEKNLWESVCTSVHSPDIECQPGSTYPLLVVPLSPRPFLYLNISSSLLPPGPKPMRVAVHSRKKVRDISSPFLSANHPHRRCSSPSTHTFLLLFLTCLNILYVFVKGT